MSIDKILRIIIREELEKYSSSILFEKKGERDTPGRLKHDSRPDRTSIRKRLGEPMVRAIEKRDGNKCVYCRRSKDKIESDGDYMTFDHLTTRQNGGGEEPTNLVLACSTCNFARQKRGLKQWVTYAAEKLNVKVDLKYVKAQAKKHIEPIYARDMK